MSINSTVQHFRAFADINHADETPLQSNYLKGLNTAYNSIKPNRNEIIITMMQMYLMETADKSTPIYRRINYMVQRQLKIDSSVRDNKNYDCDYDCDSDCDYDCDSDRDNTNDNVL